MNLSGQKRLFYLSMFSPDLHVPQQTYYQLFDNKLHACLSIQQQILGEGVGEGEGGRGRGVTHYSGMLFTHAKHTGIKYWICYSPLATSLLKIGCILTQSQTYEIVGPSFVVWMSLFAWPES